MEAENKGIKNLVDIMMKDAPLESPSTDFTATIMSQVDAIANSDVTTYKPLISKRAWFLVFALIIGVFVVSFFNGSGKTGLVTSIDLSNLANNKLTQFLSEVRFSKVTLYSIGLFAVMLAIQIPLLKGHFNKRLQF